LTKNKNYSFKSLIFIKMNINEDETNIQTIETTLTSRGKELKPFWNDKVKKISTSLWLPEKKKLKPSVDNPFLTIQTSNAYESLYVHFDYDEMGGQTPEAEDKITPSVLSENISYFAPSPNTTFIRSMKIRIYPTLKQKNVLNLWFGVYRWAYNEAKIFSEKHKVYSFSKVRNSLRTENGFLIPKKWNKNVIPERIIVGAIKDYCSNFKTSMTLLRTHQIRHFEIHSKRKKLLTQTLNLEKQCFGKGNVLFVKFKVPTITKKGEIIECGDEKGLSLRGSYKYKSKRRKKKVVSIEDIKINHDCRISYQNGKFYLLIPHRKKEDIFEPEHKIISIDSGIRTFQTGYCPDGHSIEIGKDITTKLKHLYNRVDVLNRKYFNTRVDGTFLREFKHRRTELFRKKRRTYEKIRNKIDDIHWKAISNLTQNYENIIISDFKTKSLLRLKLRRISKRVLNTLSHYRFRQRLIEKCNAHANYLFIADESYTSKTCGRCGRINQSLGSKKVFICPYDDCDYESDRDISAGRNILLKTLSELESLGFVTFHRPERYTGSS
jgi:transposase